MANNRQINASDASAWVKCRRRAWFDLHPPSELERVEDPFADLVAQVGIEHERAVLQELGPSVPAESPAHTQELIKMREPLIYQPAFTDSVNGLNGRPDFLKLELDGHYRVIDAKLAKNIKTHPEILIQLAVYARLFPSAHRPAAVLGDRSFLELSEEDLAKADEFLTDMSDLVDQHARPEADYSHSKCSACPYNAECIPDFERSKALTLIYGLDSRAVPHLQKIGVDNYATLAASNPDALADGPYFKGDRKHQLIRQASAYLTQEVEVISAPDLPLDSWVHFDVESDPIANGGAGIVYLWGFLLPDGQFTYVWADPGLDNQRDAWRRVLNLLEDMRNRYPSLTIAHFAHYEIQILRSYVSLFGDEENATAKRLLGDDSPLLDLRNVVRDHLILPLKSYGLKAVCKDPRLVNFQWTHEESGSQWSVVRYHDYLAATNGEEREQIRREILSYNEDDVRATDAMVDWLRSFAA